MANKIKTLFKEHEEGLKNFATGAFYGALAIGTYELVGRCVRKKNTTLFPDMKGLKMSDLGKLGEQLVDRLPDVTLDTDVTNWWITYKPTKK